MLIVVQDVSERKQLESEIIETTNRERRRLGADLHDGLGQELTGISLMLRSLAKRAGLAAFEAVPELDEIITLVNHAIQSARKMALGISPVTVSNAADCCPPCKPSSDGLAQAIASTSDCACPSGLRCTSANPPQLIST